MSVFYSSSDRCRPRFQLRHTGGKRIYICLYYWKPLLLASYRHIAFNKRRPMSLSVRWLYILPSLRLQECGVYGGKCALSHHIPTSSVLQCDDSLHDWCVNSCFSTCQSAWVHTRPFHNFKSSGGLEYSCWPDWDNIEMLVFSTGI